MTTITSTVYALCEEVVQSGKGISRDDAEILINLPESATLDLLAGAQRIRSTITTNTTFTCGIINAKSGKCSENCSFCAQSKYHDTGAPIYPLIDPKALLTRAQELEAGGAQRYGIVTSGMALSDKELDTVCEAALAITTQTSIKVCGSLGQLSPDMAQRLRQAGFSSYHHNLETARSHFSAICSTHEYDDDIISVQNALQAGFRVCSGGILGLGENRNQRVELACTLRDLEVPSIPMNFLTPVKGTRLENQPLLAPSEALRAIAVYRFILPTQDILIAGGRENTLGEFQSLIPMAGANGLMIGNYLTTSGRNITDDISMLSCMGVL
ncbi:biotin synthase BioB [Halodesulfovibrio aestuarii]|uniref:Biotin synthase n=1 Tax=Halodesulfovibrio aestuarii TaxID=126333 RepID=A0A8G2F8K0_9BACT|nr:biotin synthase BioB [Halodesulfovibrio aestuarii]SHJ44997.1 biotin synthase [Halodesulfovibrio aestuarii]